MAKSQAQKIREMLANDSRCSKVTTPETTQVMFLRKSALASVKKALRKK